MEVLATVRYLLKPEDVAIDNWVFRLHYRATVVLLLASSTVGFAKQYFGDPINCQTANGVSSKVMDDYCWIHSTFHVRNEFQGNVGCVLDTVLAQRSSIHVVAQETPDTAFYQWVPFTLVFQAMVFYFPRKLWKSFEGGLMESFGRDSKQCVLLTEDVHGEMNVEATLFRDEVARRYAKFFHCTLHHNNGYFLQYLICELLNLLADVFNLYFTDVFLGGRFLRYGTQVIKFYSHSHAQRRDLPNPMCTVFPTVTSCTFHSVGTAAGEQKFNSLCVLSLNIINEKIYLLLWFWFYGLTLLTGCHVLYRTASLIMPCARSFLLLVRARMFSSSDLRTVRRVLEVCYLGDWWVLYQIGRNSNTHFFRYLLRYLESSLEETSSSARKTNGSAARSNGRGRVRRHRDDVESSSRENGFECGDDDEDDFEDGAESSGQVSTVADAGELARRREEELAARRRRRHKKIGMPYRV